MLLADRPTTSRWTHPLIGGRTLLLGQADPRRQEPRPTLRPKDTRRRGVKSLFGSGLGSTFDPTRTVARAGHQRFNTGIALGLRGPADAIGKAIARRMPPASSCMTTAQPGRTSSPPRPARRLLTWRRHSGSGAAARAEDVLCQALGSFGCQEVAGRSPDVGPGAHPPDPPGDPLTQMARRAEAGVRARPAARPAQTARAGRPSAAGRLRQSTM